MYVTFAVVNTNLFIWFFMHAGLLKNNGGARCGESSTPREWAEDVIGI